MKRFSLSVISSKNTLASLECRKVELTVVVEEEEEEEEVEVAAVVVDPVDDHAVRGSWRRDDPPEDRFELLDSDRDVMGVCAAPLAVAGGNERSGGLRIGGTKRGENLRVRLQGNLCMCHALSLDGIADEEEPELPNTFQP